MYILFITLISFPVMWILSGMYAYLLFPVTVTNSDNIEKNKINKVYKYI